MGLAILFMLGTLVVSVGLGALLFFLPVLAVILVVAPGASLLVLLAYSLHVLGDTRSVVFLSQDGTATVRIRLRRGARHVQDHMAAPVSHRHGRQLREHSSARCWPRPTPPGHGSPSTRCPRRPTSTSLCFSGSSPVDGPGRSVGTRASRWRCTSELARRPIGEVDTHSHHPARGKDLRSLRHGRWHGG